MRKFLPSNRKGNADNSGKGRFEGVKRALKAPLLRTSIDLALSEDYNLVTKAAVSEIEKLAQKSGRNSMTEQFRVMPDYAYPNVKLNREELRTEVNKQSSYFHDLRPMNATPNKQILGSFYLEVLQCFGILKESKAFCLAVCGSAAFKTDVMPPVANPMWLSKMRRACIFPLFEGYANVYIGVFAHSQNSGHKELFIGRIVLDVARLRQGSTYDVTLPLRKSNVVYSREQRGAIRVRFHLSWFDERKAILSYLPIKKASFQHVTVRCVDNKAFQNVACVVHGSDIPNKFSMKLVKATIREVDFVFRRVLKKIRKREIHNLKSWKYPLISFYVFCAWMHAVYSSSFKYCPGHFVTYILLHLMKNYALYAIDGKVDGGFSAPTWEEMLATLCLGKCSDYRWTQPLEMESNDPENMQSTIEFLYDEELPKQIPLTAIANSFRLGVKRSEKGRYFGNTQSYFMGKDGVDFLVENGFADSREEAVAIGNRLRKVSQLFEHVKRKFPFQDSEVVYVFLNCDTNEYIFKTHKPWFRGWLGFLGFHDKSLSPSEAHIEMAFVRGCDQPRFTVKDSLVIRSKESKTMLQKEHDAEEEEEDINDFAINTYRRNIEMSAQPFSGIQGSALMQRTKLGGGKVSVEGSDQLLDIEVKHYQDTGDFDDINIETDDENPIIQAEKLNPTPSQENYFERKDSKKISDVLTEVRHGLHRKFGNIFNVRVYRLSLEAGTQREKLRNSSVSFAKRSRKRDRSPKSTLSILGKTASASATDVQALVKLTAQKEEYDRLLQIGRYSNKNLIISKIATILYPLVDILQMFLSMARLSFNVMTWRDPILTFWVSIFLSFFVIFLHCFPWRMFLGGVGAFYLGPHNWILRVFKERQGGGESDYRTKAFKKRRGKPLNQQEDYAPYFSSDNKLIRENQLDTSIIKEVAVPLTPLYFRRFYDWPPEPEYARVSKCAPPDNDPAAEQILEDDGFGMYDSNNAPDDSLSGRVSWRSRVKGMRKRAK